MALEVPHEELLVQELQERLCVVKGRLHRQILDPDQCVLGNLACCAELQDGMSQEAVHCPICGVSPGLVLGARPAAYLTCEAVHQHPLCADFLESLL